MDDDEIREHIQAAIVCEASEARRLTYRMLSACWPGGSADRTEPAALGWIRHWRPDTLGASLPACSCASGRCLLCN
jgi:hypothetical protein